MKVHLIDATYELFRAYYGAPSARDKGGREVGATRGLARSLTALLRDPEVSHVACAFDHTIESFRNELFEGYKTSAGIEPDLLAQFELAEAGTRALGIVTWSMIEVEADDAIATAAARFSEEPDVEQVVIGSPDKDLAQCVRGQSVVLWDRRRDVVLDEPGVVDKFGVAPGSIPDYLALVGDSADGIPGLAGWGQKSAAAVLARYGTIESIPRDPADWDVPIRGAARLAAVLAAELDAALLYRRLATLRRDVALRESLDDLRWRGAPEEALLSFCESIGDRRLVDRVPGPKQDRVVSASGR